MSVEEREKIITEIRKLTVAEADTMAWLGVNETGMGRVEHKYLKHLLVADKTPGTEDIVPTAKTGDNGLTLIDLTEDTVTQTDVLSSKTVHLANGDKVEGSMLNNGAVSKILDSGEISSHGEKSRISRLFVRIKRPQEHFPVVASDIQLMCISSRSDAL